MDNWINDVMHTVFEGIIPDVSDLVISSLIQQHFFTIDELNDSVLKIHSLLLIEKPNKPPDIRYGSGKVTFKMSSAQMWAWFRFLPASIGSRVPKDSEHWRLMTMLQEIVDIVLAPVIRDSTLFYFESVYAMFIELLKNLYPCKSITPKIHFLVHFPTIVRKNGPMRNFWAMNFERLNGSFRRPAHIMNNFRNPPFTLSKKQQFSSLEAILSRDFMAHRSEICNVTQLKCSKYPSIDFEPYFCEPGQSSVSVTNFARANGTDYKKGYFVVVDRDERGLFFGKIDTILCENIDRPLLLLNLYNTKLFENHLYCYCVEQKYPTQTIVCDIVNLLDYYPLDCFEKNGNSYIRLKHGII